MAEEIGSHITITDPAHPLYGQTLPVVRRATTWRKRYLVVRLPNGRTRAVPLAATQPHSQPSSETSVLLPISARTLLPVARRLQMMAQLTEEADDVAPSHSTHQRTTAKHRPGDPVATGADSTERPRRPSTPTLRPASGRSDRAYPRRQQGGCC